MYSSILSLTSALNGMCRQRHAMTALPREKTRYPLYRRLGGPQGRSPPGFDPQIAQPVVSCYTD
jgi:hypothetical protein